MVWWHCLAGSKIPIAKGKWSRGSATPRKTPLKGMRFESLEEAQAYLDRWEQRWADTRIHGTTKRQVAMFTEEKPHLIPLPLEPFRYYQYGERVVHLEVPLYRIFYSGNKPPAPPQRAKSNRSPLWGSKGKDARLLMQLRRTLRHTRKRDRELLLQMARKLARGANAKGN